ncbi:MAG: glycosyltransferase [Flavobacteriales bacterium]|jgi:glycosyltransferase involved in cell wall biosynthesis|nr:glycosyltransferase [Flavobacteriales bacterium]
MDPCISSLEPILLICHGFPPVRGIGGRRWAKFAKELARRGHPVHVIRNEGTTGLLDSLWSADAAHPGIIDHPMPQRYPTVLFKRPITALIDKVKYRVWSKLLPLMVRGNIFDSGALWKRQLLSKSRDLIRKHGIRNVIVTGAPFSLMAYATELKKPFPGINLVADFRDVWTWGTDYGQGSMSARQWAHEKQMEALVAQASDKLISPHGTVVDHLRKTYGGASGRYVTLPHAIDPEDFDPDVVPKKDGVYRMIYAGSLYGAGEAERYFGALLDSFDVLRRDKPDTYRTCRLDLYITGHGTAAYERTAKERGADDRIHFHPPLPPREIYGLVARADLVIAFIPSRNKDVLGTKFNEIFYLRRPVLHIGEPGLVSRTIIGRKLGDSLRVEELPTELPRIISGERPIAIDVHADHSAFLLGPLTDRLIAEVLV